MSTLIKQKYLWLICGLLSLFVAISAFRLLALPKLPKVEAVRVTADDFIAHVKQGHLDDAFDLLSKTFQTSIQNDPNALRGSLETLGLYKQDENVSIDWRPSYPFQRDRPRRFLTGRFGPESQPKAVVIIFIQDADHAWKIHAINAFNLSDNENFELADIDKRLKTELSKSVDIFFRSIKENDIDSFYNHLSQAWRDRVRADHLRSKFATLLGEFDAFGNLDIHDQILHVRHIDKNNDTWNIHAAIDLIPSGIYMSAAYINEAFDLKLNKFDIHIQCHLGPFCPDQSVSRSVLLLIDNSDSVKETEQEAFQRAIQHFVDQLRGNIQIRIRLYGQESPAKEQQSSQLVILPRDGKNVLQQFIAQNLNFQDNATHTAAAVQAAIEQLEADAESLGNAQRLEKMIILISDGPMQRADNRAEDTELIGAIASMARRQNIRIHTVAVRSGPNQIMLNQLSEITQGYHLNTFHINDVPHSDNLQDELSLLADVISRTEPWVVTLHSWLSARSQNWFYLAGGFASNHNSLSLEDTIGVEPPESDIQEPTPRALLPVGVVLFIVAGCCLCGFVYLRYRESAPRAKPEIITMDDDMCLRGIGGEALNM